MQQSRPVEQRRIFSASDVAQFEYCPLAWWYEGVILEDLYAKPPQYGLLRYASHEFTIQNTESLRRKVLQRLVEMEHCDERRPPALTRQLASKCRICPFQPICPVASARHNPIS